MRRCEKCSRELQPGVAPDCDEEHCPAWLDHAGKEDRTLVDQDFDRQAVLRMASRMSGDDDDQSTSMDAPRPDVTALYDDEEDRPAFIDEILRKQKQVADASAVSPSTVDEEGEPEESDESGGEPAVTAAEPGEPAEPEDLAITLEPDDETSGEEGSSDAVPRVALFDDDVAETQPFAAPGAHTTDLTDDGEDDDDDETLLFDPANVDEIAASEADEVDEDHHSAAEDHVDEVDEVDDVAVTGKLEASNPEIATVELSSADVLAETSPPSLRPRLSLADLRASLRSSKPPVEPEATLEDPITEAEDEFTVGQDDTEGEIDAMSDEAFEEDPTTKLEQSTIDAFMAERDSTLQIDDDDLLDFTDELLDGADGATVELKQLQRPSTNDQRTAEQPMEFDTVEAPKADRHAQPPQHFPQQPPVTPQPHPGQHPQQGPYGSGMAPAPQYPPAPYGESGMHPPQQMSGYPGYAPQPQYPQQLPSQPDPGPGPESPQQQPPRKLTAEIALLVAIVVLIAICIVLLIAVW